MVPKKKFNGTKNKIQWYQKKNFTKIFSKLKKYNFFISRKQKFLL